MYISNRLIYIFKMKLLFLMLFLWGVRGGVVRNSRSVSGDQFEEMTSHLQLLEMDYADQCSNLSKARRKVLLGERDSYENEFQALLSYGAFVKHESDDMKQTYGSDSAGELTVRWIALERNPDALVDHIGWRKLAKLQIDVERAVYSLRVPCKNIPCDKLPCPKYESDCIRRRTYLSKLMRESKDPAALKATWLAAQKPLEAIGAEQFDATLKLAGKETRTNWERLSGCTSEDEGWLCGYSLVEELWSEIEPLYTRLVKYVYSRLKQVYRLDESDLLPIEFLGSLNTGEEGWLGAASSIVPHRRLLDELKTGLNEISDAKTLQLSAEKLIRSVGLGPHNGHHVTKIIPNCLRCWSASGELLSYCQGGLSELLVPNNTVDIDVDTWLDAHEKSMHAALSKSLTDSSLASYDLALENHPLTEALIQLAPSHAIQRLALAGGLIPDEVLQDENAANSAILLNAIRILPRLAYYRMADQFRIKHLEDDIESKKLHELWWESKRKDVQVTSSNLTWDMLTDKHIVTNRPHMAKFLGIVLHYELLERKDDSDMQTILRKIAKESSWPAANWQNSLKEHLGIDRIVAEPLLEYFRPLYDYMDNTETIKQVIVPVTLRTTTTSSTTTTTVAPLSEVITESASKASNRARVEVIATTVPPKAVEETPEGTSSHTAAIAGALIGMFALLIIVGLLGRRTCANRNRQRRNATSSNHR